MTPPPPLAPPALHFLVLDFTITCGVMQFTFECTTDTAVRLTLHLSTEKPIVRRIPYVKRGADFTMSSVTCFVATSTYVQNEAGDTLTHTFTVPIAGYFLPYYWYLTGTHGGAPSHSMSQIFNVTCGKPTAPTERCQAIGQTWGSIGTYNCTDHSCAFKPTTSFWATSIDIRYCLSLAVYQCYQGRLFLFNAQADAKPTTLIAGPISFTHPPMANYECKIQNIPIDPPILFTAGNNYAFAYGWRDYNHNRYLRMAWGIAYNPTCPLVPPPYRYIWRRRYYRAYRQWCAHLVQNWYQYYYSYPLYFKFYGTDA